MKLLSCLRLCFLSIMALIMVACSTAQPKNINNVCDIYDEYYDWYNASKAVNERYGIPEAVTMAFILPGDHDLALAAERTKAAEHMQDSTEAVLLQRLPVRVRDPNVRG